MNQEIKKTVLEVEKLNFTYFSDRENKQNILKDISFRLEEGEICALLGQNASGKTTLLRCLNRILEIQSGKILVNGKNIKEQSRLQISHLFAFVPQEHNILFPFSAVDIVVMGRNPHLNMFGKPKKEDYEKALEVMQEIGIIDLQSKAYTKLSGGQRQLVLLARALVQETKILLLDEPTSHLDIKNRYIIMKKLIPHYQKKGLIIILALHHPSEALQNIHKTLLLHKGKVLGFGSPKDILTKENLTLAYDIPLELYKIPNRDEQILLLDD